MNDRDRVIREAVDLVIGAGAHQAQLIAVGWAAFCKSFAPPKLAEDQMRLLKLAYFAGAQRVWASVFAMLDAGDEPTEQDMRRMAAVGFELDRWAKQMEEMMLKPAAGRS